MADQDKKMEEKLFNTLRNMETPRPDGDKKAEALKNSIAAFEKAQFDARQNELAGGKQASHKDSVYEKNKNNDQGLSILSRLIGIGRVKSASKPQGNRRVNMENKKKKAYWKYGLVGLPVVMFFGINVVTSVMTTSSGVGSGNHAFSGFSMDGKQLASVSELSPNMRARISEKNEFGGRVAEATSPSFIPAPSGAPSKERQEIARAQRVAPSDSAKMAEAPALMDSVPSPEVMALNKPLNNFMDSMDMDAEADMAAVAPEIVAPEGEEGRDKFEDFEVSPVKSVAVEPVSTFSIDVDTASYSFMRRALNRGYLPPMDAVRLEELINYFDYNYSVPSDLSVPFQPSVVVTPSPWKADAKLMHIGIKGYMPVEQPAANLVFLLDVSGSMSSADKLPLVKQSMQLLLDNLKPTDKVSIVVYAGAAGVVLDPTEARNKSDILNALNRLQAGGSTAGGQGLALAYQLAEQNFEENAVNRIILATDGDFNVGIRNHEELKDYVARKRDKGIFLSVLGFGQGNLNDQLMQTLAQNGNGVAAYIDTIAEARKVLVTEATSSLFPIAKDVKIQVEFNPAAVSEYRLIGYETRALAEEDFNNDKVDAGDIGAGHSVTAIYEFVPKGYEGYLGQRRYGELNDKLSVQPQNTDEYAYLKMRYKLPDENTSKLIEKPIKKSVHDVERLENCGPADSCLGMEIPNTETGFATAVATFGQLLKGGKYTGQFTYDDVIKLAKYSKGDDPYGYRAEFIKLVELAKTADAMRK